MPLASTATNSNIQISKIPMHKLLFFAAITLMGVTAHAQQASFETVKVTHSPIQGIGFETGTMRRDPSDVIKVDDLYYCLLYTSPSPRDATLSRMPSSA